MQIKGFVETIQLSTRNIRNVAATVLADMLIINFFINRMGGIVAQMTGGLPVMTGLDPAIFISTCLRRYYIPLVNPGQGAWRPDNVWSLLGRPIP